MGEDSIYSFNACSANSANFSVAEFIPLTSVRTGASVFGIFVPWCQILFHITRDTSMLVKSIYERFTFFILSWLASPSVDLYASSSFISRFSASMYTSLSSMTMPEPLSARLMMIESLYNSSWNALFSFFV